MKILCLGMILLCTLALACAATTSPSMDSHSRAANQQQAQTSHAQVSQSAPSHSNHGAAILSRAEADSLSVQGDSVLAQSGIGDIAVGEGGGYDLLYVLVVVLVVVLIIAVVR